VSVKAKAEAEEKPRLVASRWMNSGEQVADELALRDDGCSMMREEHCHVPCRFLPTVAR